MRRSSPLGRPVLAVVPAALLAGVLALVPLGPAAAGPYDSAGPTPPPSGDSGTGSANGGTCSMYGSSAGFGVVCSSGGGATLAELLEGAGIDVTSGAFCWDDDALPDRFVPPPGSGPERWYVHTCLSFPTGVITRPNAVITYEYVQPGTPDELTPPQEIVIETITRRGQIPFLHLTTTPIASPRVSQDVAFTVDCGNPAIRVCRQDGDRLVVETERIRVQGIEMWAELIHMRVQPEGARGPNIDCFGGGLPRTAEQLDAVRATQPGVCRHRYDRSSNGRGGGTSGDRWPARLTAYWTVFYDAPDGSGALADGRAYEKTSVHQVRVTEVQTLVVG